jgi:NTP pyrophosphatase (non-canonical NTP hydrolase)
VKIEREKHIRLTAEDLTDGWTEERLVSDVLMGRQIPVIGIDRWPLLQGASTVCFATYDERLIVLFDGRYGSGCNAFAEHHGGPKLELPAKPEPKIDADDDEDPVVGKSHGAMIPVNVVDGDPVTMTIESWHVHQPHYSLQDVIDRLEGLNRWVEMQGIIAVEDLRAKVRGLLERVLLQESRWIEEFDRVERLVFEFGSRGRRVVELAANIRLVDPVMVELAANIRLVDPVIDPEAPGDVQPGEITDPEGYAAAKAEGRVVELNQWDDGLPDPYPDAKYEKITISPVLMSLEEAIAAAPTVHEPLSNPGMTLLEGMKIAGAAVRSLTEGAPCEIDRRAKYENGFRAAPPRYMQGAREVIDLMRDAMTDEEFAVHCAATAFKYEQRAGAKGDPIGDAEKAAWYRQMAHHVVDPKTPDPRVSRPGFEPYARSSAPMHETLRAAVLGGVLEIANPKDAVRWTDHNCEITPNEYQHAALRTEFTPDFLFVEGPDGHNRMMARLLHGAIGLCTETGELQDQIKKHLMYKREFDRVNVIEECGDLLWYLALILDAVGGTIEDAMIRNVGKLRKRYPEKFTIERAVERDLDAERAALESRDLKSRGRIAENLGYTMPISDDELDAWGKKG